MGNRLLAFISALVIVIGLYSRSQYQTHTTTSSALSRDTMAAKNVVVIGGSYVGMLIMDNAVGKRSSANAEH